MRAFFSVVRNIAKCCQYQDKIIIEKSTVPVGTAILTRDILT